MGRYEAGTQVVVLPFVRQPDGEEVVIGRPEAGSFLALPPDAVAILDDLAAGLTVGGAQERYRERHGELPDLAEFLELLEEKGFVFPFGASARGTSPSVSRYHFAQFPQPLARLLFSPPVLAAGGALMLLAVVLTVLDPSLLPGSGALVFDRQFTAPALGLFLTSYFMVFLHEMAHLVAARAYGVNSRLGVSHRLWMLVAETDLTGIWALPPRQRYLPLLAGPFLDGIIAAVLVVVLRWGALQPGAYQICRALLFLYLLQLLWQCYCFLRTDLYYLIANRFRCKNLMGDTEAFLRRRDLSHVPAAELPVIRWYAVVYVLGRLLAIGTFVFLLLPVVWTYFAAVFAVLKAGFRADPEQFVDAALMGGIVLAHRGAGLWLWVRSLLERRRAAV